MSDLEVLSQPQTPTAVRRHLRDMNSPTKTPAGGPAAKIRRVEVEQVVDEPMEEDDGSDGDSDDSNAEEIYNKHHTQMKIRAKMYRLADKVELVHRRIENGDDNEEGVHKCVKRYTHADILHKDNKEIVNGRDLAVDSLCGDRLSRMLITKVGLKSSNASKFNLIAFAEALAPLKDTYFDEQLATVIELPVPRIVGYMFDFMAVPKEKKPRAERKPVKRSAKGELVTIEGKQTKDLDDGNDHSLLEHLNRIQKVYRNYLKAHDTDRINYYEFVIDPESYPNTVENCFYTSFLLKDNLFFLERVNPETPPMLRKLTREERAIKEDMEQGGPPREKHQCVNTMSWHKWQLMTRRFNITEAILPPATGH